MKFVPPAPGQPGLNNAFTYGFHFDAGLYAAYLRDYAMARGVERVEGTVGAVDQHPETGFVTALRLKDGRTRRGRPVH
jgi:hypothetical protein